MIASKGAPLRRLITGFALVALVGLLLGALALTELRATARRNQALVGEYLGQVVLAEALGSVSNAAARKARDYLLTGDEAHLRPLEAARARFLELHDQLGRNRSTPEERALLGRVHQQWFAAGAAANRAMEARRRAGRLEGEAERLVAGAMLPERQRFDVALEALTRYERALYEAAQRDADRSAERAWWLLAAGFLGAVASSLALGALLVRTLRQRERAEAARAVTLADERRLRAEAEEALALLDTLLATAPVGMAFVDQGLRFVRVNRVLAESNGATVEAHLGRTVSQVLPALAPTLEPLMRRVLEGESVLGVELSGPDPSHPGRQAHWLASYYPVRDASGRVFMAGAVVVDISERKRAEEELHQAAQFRERLIGIVSHDLRTPLAAITTGATLLLRTEGVPEPALRAARRISASAERMARMISELLDFTRVRLGAGIPVQRAPGDLLPVVRHALEEAELAFAGRQVRLEVHGDLRGEWDLGRLAQVVGNLVNNALAYSPEGAPVTVRAGEDAPGWVRLEVQNPNRDGPIPPEQLPTLFDPFQRGGAGGVQAAPEGLGLGLYIARELVAAHGGSIVVASSAEGGTTFTLRLPRTAPAAG